MSAVIDVRISSLPRPGRNHFTANGVPLSLATWTTPWPPSPIRFSVASGAPARSIRSVSPGWISPSTSRPSVPWQPGSSSAIVASSPLPSAEAQRCAQPGTSCPNQ